MPECRTAYRVSICSVDLEEHCADEEVEWLEQTVREHVPAASAKRTPNLLVFTLPMGDSAAFPGPIRAVAYSCKSCVHWTDRLRAIGDVT